MKLSIIVPVYNLEEYIAITLDSLLSVHFDDDYEILVINDGSTDSSEKIIRSYQKKNSKIVLYTIENQGVSNARNFGLSKAIGKYITFLDGDDTVEPYFFEKAVSELEIGGYDFIQGNYKIVEKKNSKFIQYVKKDEVITECSSMMEKFLGSQKIIHNNVWGKVFRADFAKSAQFDRKIRVAEDQKYIFDLITKANKIKLLSVHAINYFQRKSSVMHNIHIGIYNDLLAVFDYCKENISNANISKCIDAAKQRILLGLYNDFVIKDSEIRGNIYCEIIYLNDKSIKKYNGKKDNIKIWVLKNMRFFYDFILNLKEKMNESAKKNDRNCYNR